MSIKCLNKNLLTFSLVIICGTKCYANTQSRNGHFARNYVSDVKGDLIKWKIGIVGGGIGGTATAYFLRDLLKDDVRIDLYEPNAIGGRLAVSTKFDDVYETGGSIIHPKNQYMNDFIAELGLKKNNLCPGGKLGIFDGNEFNFVESNWKFMNLINTFVRYGLDIMWLNNLNDAMLSHFSKIYALQNEGCSFKTVFEMLRAMDGEFPSMLTETIRSYLAIRGLHERIIDEIVAAVTRANYGQMPNVHAFVGSVAVAAATPDLWSVSGGNKGVPEGLLERSGAIRREAEVELVEQQEDGKFKITFQTSSGQEEEFYDAVSLAIPLAGTTYPVLRLLNASLTARLDSATNGRYEPIVATLVSGQLNETTFSSSGKHDASIDEILTDNPSLFYNSVGRQRPVNLNCNILDDPVFKVFSPLPLTQTQLDYLFKSYSMVEEVKWLAYPHYEMLTEDHFLELTPGLVHNNAIEWAASAMEMSAVSAKNAAFLIINYLTNTGDAQSTCEPFGKQEL